MDPDQYNPYKMNRIARAIVLCSCLFTLRARAQEPLITHRDLVVLGAATAGSALLSLYDARIAHGIGDTLLHARHSGYTTAAKRASVVTETVLMGAGGVVYFVANRERKEATANVALHSTISVLSAATFIQVVRGITGRARPYVVDEDGRSHDSNPYDFNPLHGFTSFNYRSFPSMHAMASFAVASALSQEMRFRHTPRRNIISPALYAGAAIPALARLYLDEHWASDIALGVFLGVSSGQKVVQYTHSHPNNWLDRRFLGSRATATVSVGAGGFSFGVVPY
jgi:membrane-associated phospholipid phosphatase